MYYILEPQCDQNAEHGYPNGTEDGATYFAPCEVGKATLFAVFTRETRNDPNEDAEYLGDLNVADVMQLLARKA